MESELGYLKRFAEENRRLIDTLCTRLDVIENFAQSWTPEQREAVRVLVASQLVERVLDENRSRRRTFWNSIYGQIVIGLGVVAAYAELLVRIVNVRGGGH